MRLGSLRQGRRIPLLKSISSMRTGRRWARQKKRFRIVAEAACIRAWSRSLPKLAPPTCLSASISPAMNTPSRLLRKRGSPSLSMFRICHKSNFEQVVCRVPIHRGTLRDDRMNAVTTNDGWFRKRSTVATVLKIKFVVGCDSKIFHLGS